MSVEPDSEPFEEFMSRALMDPVNGYYSRRVKGIGSRGDFATSASISGALAGAIANWLKEEMSRNPEVQAVIEVGGGEGHLMKDVRRELGWWRRRKLQWMMVERSEPLRKRQREVLGAGVREFQDLESALAACKGRAFIWHNEFLDALPFSLVQWCRDELLWKEVWLWADATGNLMEELKPISRWNPSEFSVTRDWGDHAETPSFKQRAEVHTGVHRWLSSFASEWKGGAMLQIDYGDVFPALYHRRPRGTARAYLLHQRLEGSEIYQNVGRQDITSDINFTDLRRWCLSLGFEETGYGTQSEFLLRYGRTVGSEADRFIADSEGAGTAFKFLSVRPK